MTNKTTGVVIIHGDSSTCGMKSLGDVVGRQLPSLSVHVQRWETYCPKTRNNMKHNEVCVFLSERKIFVIPNATRHRKKLIRMLVCMNQVGPVSFFLSAGRTRTRKRTQTHPPSHSV